VVKALGSQLECYEVGTHGGLVVSAVGTVVLGYRRVGRIERLGRIS